MLSALELTSHYPTASYETLDLSLHGAAAATDVQLRT